MPRDQVVISTKKQPDARESAEGATADQLVTAKELAAGLEASLRRLRTDYIDLYHLHGLLPSHYEYARETLVPELLRLKQQGKIRHTGVTEMFGKDTRHETVQRAVRDGWAEVVMVGFNMLNQSARELVFPLTRKGQIGVMVMFAVRRVFSMPDRLSDVVGQLVADGTVDADQARLDGSLEFLVNSGGATSIPDTAYRYCLYEPGCDVIISGTGNLDHLRENVVSLQAGPLPAADVARVNQLFGRVDSVTGS